LYYGIACVARKLGGEEVKADGGWDVDVGAGGGGSMEAGFRVGKNRRGTVYAGPRPVLGHRVYRYMFDVVALGEGLAGGGLSAVPTKEELARAVEGKVVGCLAKVGIGFYPCPDHTVRTGYWGVITIRGFFRARR
jgi:hypothetical protein